FAALRSVTIGTKRTFGDVCRLSSLEAERTRPKTPGRTTLGHKTHGKRSICGTGTLSPAGKSSRPRNEAPGVSSIARVSSTRADRARPMATQPHHPSGCWIFAGTRGAVEIG